MSGNGPKDTGKGSDSKKRPSFTLPKISLPTQQQIRNTTVVAQALAAKGKKLGNEAITTAYKQGVQVSQRANEQASELGAKASEKTRQAVETAKALRAKIILCGKTAVCRK
jgi:hypothetical protein